MHINNLPDDTVKVVVDLLKQLNANMPKEEMHQKVTQILDNLSDPVKDSIYLAL